MHRAYRPKRVSPTVARTLLPVALLVLVWGATAVSAGAATAPVFGPEDFIRGTGAPETKARSFSTAGFTGPFLLQVANGGADGSLERSSSALVTLNGEVIFGPRDFNQTVELLDREIVLEPDNELGVEVRSLPGSGFTLTVLGNRTQPEIEILAPESGLVTSSASVQVSGVFSGAVESVVVNGVAATLDGTSFTAAVPLEEGTNRLVATAIDGLGSSATASISVRRDTTPPLVVIETPADGDRLVSEVVTVAGTVNDIIPGATINEDDVTVKVNGQPAPVMNRTFIVPDLPLELGDNTLTAVAVDRAGNTASSSIVVSREPDLAGIRIVITGGNNQRGPIGSSLPDPLSVRVLDEEGQPIAGRPLTFAVSRGDGLLGSPADNLRSQTLLTAADGTAAASFQLGSRTGEGFHRVRVTTPGSLTFAEFCATAEPAPPSTISVTMAPPAKAAVGRPLAEPLSVIVNDNGGNGVPGVPVTFRVVLGGGSFEGDESVEVLTDPDGIAEAVWTLGPDPGVANNKAAASFEGNPGLPVTFVVSGLATGPARATRIVGVVQNSAGEPIPGARAVLRGSDREAVTGADGRFVIRDVPPGGHRVGILGSAANDPTQGIFYPDIDFAVEAVSGADNELDQVVVLPFLDMAGAKLAGGDEDVILEMKGVPGFAIKVFANSVILPDGSRGEVLMSSSQVKFDKVPMPPPQGSTPLVVGTLQPAGIRFDPPAQVIYPNVEGLAPGDVADIFAFHHDIGQFVNVGPGTVTEDGSVVVSDPGFGIVQAGWHCLIRLPGPAADCANDCSGDLQWRIVQEDGSLGPAKTRGPVVLAPGGTAAQIQVDFSPGGGSFDSQSWSGGPPLVSLSDQSAAGTTAEVTATSGSESGSTTLTSPTYRIPVPDEEDKTCEAEVDVVVAELEVRQDDTVIEEDDVAFITADPEMPNLTARLIDGPADITVSWNLEVAYQQGNRDDQCFFPGPDGNATTDLPGDQVWDIHAEFGTDFCGGEATLTYSIDGSEPQEFPFRIHGKNATQATVRGELALLRHHLIAWREGRFQQFQTLAGFVQSWEEGPFSVLHSSDNGFGIMQLTAGAIPIDQLWNWEENANEGESRADDFTDNAETYNDQVQQGQNWTGATGGTPPNEGTAFPNAPEFSNDELDRETWARYNSGFRYHDFDPAQGAWVNRNVNAPGNQYADDLNTRRDQIQQNNVFPPLWN